MGLIDWLKDKLGMSDYKPLESLRPRAEPMAAKLNDRLHYATKLLGPGSATTTFCWPPRADWSREQIEARQIRASEAYAITSNIAKENPHLKSYLDRIGYNPEAFDVKNNSRARTGGWIDDPNNQPYSILNDPAFSDAHTLRRTIRHEIWHGIQRNNPLLYRGPPGSDPRERQRFREFDAHLRDIEYRDRLGLDGYDKMVSLTEATRNLVKAQQQPSWTQIDNKTRESYINRFVTQREALYNELVNTPYAKTHEFKEIYGWGDH